MSKVARNVVTAVPEEIGRQVTNGELRQTVNKIGEGALVIPRAVGETVSKVGDGALVIPRAIGKRIVGSRRRPARPARTGARKRTGSKRRPARTGARKRTGSKRKPSRTGSKKRPRRKGSGKRR